MRKVRYFLFDSFRLDLLDERLWEGETSVRIGHKALLVLEQLVSRPGQLVTKDDLLSTAWSNIAVSDAVLTTVVREIRRALGDKARVPRFIETVHGRGYRFIGQVTETAISGPATQSKKAPELDAIAHSGLPRLSSSSFLVGREAELATLREWYATVKRGERRIGFLAGEAGIGKTVTVEAFVSEASAKDHAVVARGQCIQQYGAGEAYLPILEALGRLARDNTLTIVDVLRDYAPSWLPHLPLLAPQEEAAAHIPVTSQKMLRELADALEVYTERETLILVLEDLHWSDTATLEWLAYIARRRNPARLLIVGTYRPVEALLHKHPLRSLIAELRPYPECPELVLDYLSDDSVFDYVLQLCGNVSNARDLAGVLHRRTGGHPLFLTTIVEELMVRRSPEAADEPDFGAAFEEIAEAIASVVPSSVRQFIEHRFEQLPGKDQAIIEAASVAGHPFSVAAVVAATSLPAEEVESCCVHWARAGQFFSADGTATWPDGTIAARYGFRHALFQEVMYARIPPSQRASLHQRIGNCLESAYRKRATTIAAELAVHFDEGRDLRKAVSYLEQAARNAVQRSAYYEAGRHLNRGRELLEALPEGRARLRLELELSLLRGQVLATTKGWGVAEVELVYGRARELCEQLGDVPRLLQSLWGLIGMSVVRGRLRETQALAEEVLTLASTQGDTVFRLAAHMELGGTDFSLGNSTSARKHFREAETIYDPQQYPIHIARFTVDLGLFSRIWETHLLWHDGYADRALANAEQALARARHLDHPFSLTLTLAYAAMLSQFRREVDEVDRLAKATISHSAEHGFAYYHAWAEVLEGWSVAIREGTQDGIAEIQRGIEMLEATAGMRLPYYRGLLAETLGCAGRTEEALHAIADSFEHISRTGERWWEAELHRLQGELLRSRAGSSPESEGCFQRAIDVARAQPSKALELRAAISLARLWRDEGKRIEALGLLTVLYDGFTEGFETPDLKEAKTLIEALSS
jgi:DNA-binding winged helix-turn-helix (wHTH) protein/predicted ATPase